MAGEEQLKDLFEEQTSEENQESQEQTSEENQEESVESQTEETLEEESSEEPEEETAETEKDSEESSEEESEEGSEEESEEESEEKSEEESEETPEIVNNVKELFPEFANDITNEKDAVDALYRYTKENRKDVEKLVGVLDQHPEIGEIMRLTSEGYDFLPALIKTKGVDSIKDTIEALENNEEETEDLKKAQDEFNQSLKEQQKHKQQLEKNEKKSAENIQKFTKDKGLTKEHMESFLNEVDTDLNKVYQNEITQEFLDKMYKAYRYDQDVKEAEKTGETKGRNQKITAKKKKKKETDGVPHPSGTKKKNEEKREPTSSDKLMNSIDEYVNKHKV